MGCWNGTCGLTHLPIRHGDKVRAYILVPKRYDYPHLYKDDSSEENVFAGAGITYSTGEFHPLTYGMRGEYDDYGGIEKVKKDANVKAVLAYFNNKIKHGLKTYEPENFDKNRKPISKFTNIDDLLHSIERSGIRDTKLPFGFVMFHESAIQALLKSMAASENDGWPRYTREQLVEQIKEKSKNLQELDKIRNTSDKSDELMLKLVRLSSDIHSRDLFNPGESPRINHRFQLDHLEEMLLDPKAELIEDLADHIIICNGMDTLRRTWVSQAGCGSQAENYRVHRNMAEYVLAHVAERKREHERDIDMSIPEEREYCDRLY